MTTLSLYQIAQEYRHITDVLQDSEADEQTIADTLDGAVWTLELKAQNIGFMIRNMEVAAEAIKSVESQMSVRRTAMEKRVMHMKEFLKTGMEIAGVTKLSCPHFEISIRNNPPSVDVYESGLVPAEFMRQPPTPPAAPDKAAIKLAINSGEEVAGCKLVSGTKLVIK